MRTERYRRDLNAQRRRKGLGAHRLILLEEGGTSTQDLVDLVEVTSADGWDVATRRFDQFGQQEPLAIKVCVSAGLTAAMLARVAGFAIFDADDMSATRYRTTPSGIPALVNEVVWRFSGQRIGGTATLPVSGDAFSYVFDFQLA